MKALINMKALIKITRDYFHDKLFKKKEKTLSKALELFFILRLKSKKANHCTPTVLDPSLQNSKK